MLYNRARLNWNLLKDKRLMSVMFVQLKWWSRLWMTRNVGNTTMLMLVVLSPFDMKYSLLQDVFTLVTFFNMKCNVNINLCFITHAIAIGTSMHCLCLIFSANYLTCMIQLLYLDMYFIGYGVCDINGHLRCGFLLIALVT